MVLGDEVGDRVVGTQPQLCGIAPVAAVHRIVGQLGVAVVHRDRLSGQNVLTLDAIHHPEDHHNQSDDPENEPDHPTHFQLLFLYTMRPVLASLTVGVSCQPGLPYKPTRGSGGG